jgi:general secretion pathway protein D
MNIKILFSVVSAFAAICAYGAATADPTKATDSFSDALKRRLLEDPSMRIQALVVGVREDGVALIGERVDGASPARKGTVLRKAVGSVGVDVKIRSITPSGVELDTSNAGEGVILPGSFTALPAPQNPPSELLRHLECEKVPVGTLMRLVADQTGVNISVSDAASSKAASMFLRNVPADIAVEEVCRATGLWFRRETGGRVLRVMTMDEYAEGLNTFREESTEMFTLLYPNVIEVASVIYGLHPDRTFVSLGEEEFDEDEEYDLSRRFRRFRVIEDNGGSQFMDIEAPQVTGSGSRTGGSGAFSFSRGGAASRLSQWDQLRQRSRKRSYADRVGADDAKLAEFAYGTGNTNLLQQIKNQVTPAAASIFVTLSRKNNVLIVRTSDSRVMDEIRAVVKRLDVPTPMVLMEVKVLELDVTDDFTAEFSYSFNRETKPYNATDSETGALANNVLSGFPGFSPVANNPIMAGAMSFQVVSDKIAARVQLLQQDGKVKTLATPTLLTANNEVSRIFSGVEYPIVTGWTPGSTSSSAVGGGTTVFSTPTIERQDIGTMLLITPNINADKTITLRLLQENSAVSAEKASIPVLDSSGSKQENKEVQFVESRSLVGTFVAKDNATILAGGLIKETESEMYKRTPVLGSLPLVGWLFRGTEKVKRRTELIVLIKPHVISTPFEGGRISKELLEALSAHPAADGRTSMGVHKEDKEHTVIDDIHNLTNKNKKEEMK